LGCLLGDRIGIELRRVGSGTRYTFTNPGEQKLDAWMEANAFVVWLETATPREVELGILRSGLPLPLNVRDTPDLRLTTIIQRARQEATRRSNELPLVADSGGTRRAQ
jgi:hypothetical protein